MCCSNYILRYNRKDLGEKYMWHEILYRVLSIINYVVLVVILLPLFVQCMSVFLFWVKKKTYPKSDKKARIAYLIPAHNESSVIYQTVKDLRENQDYPKDLFDVIVIADNCTDNTAELAKKAGAIVYERHDPDPSHRMALYPLKEGIDRIIHAENPHDMVIHLDADNHVNKEFSSLMNDAFQSGVVFARPFEGGTNSTQNFYTKACTLFYCFDSRYGSRVRERFGIAAHVNGAGAMMATSMLLKCGGYDVTSISDDAEFNFNRMLEGTYGHYVEDAVVYEDMPSSFKDTVNRTQRIGSGGMKLLKTKLMTMLGKFFVTGRISYVEMFLTYIFNFLAVLLCVWVPAFFIYDFIYTYMCGYGMIEVTYQAPIYYYTVFWNTLWSVVGVVGGLFVIFGFLQALFVVLTDYKKLGAKRRRDMISAVFFFAGFVFLYAMALAYGAMHKPKGWKEIKRNAPQGDQGE